MTEKTHNAINRITAAAIDYDHSHQEFEHAMRKHDRAIDLYLGVSLGLFILVVGYSVWSIFQ